MSIDVKAVLVRDRNDRDILRVGRTAFSIRKDGDHWKVDDARKWDPTVASCTSYDEAVDTVERLLASAPR